MKNFIRVARSNSAMINFKIRSVIHAILLNIKCVTYIDLKHVP